jgi:hypothetical protein
MVEDSVQTEINDVSLIHTRIACTSAVRRFVSLLFNGFIEYCRLLLRLLFKKV